MKIPNNINVTGPRSVSLARIVSEDSQRLGDLDDAEVKSSKDS